jgi:NAD(P)-dependent dehydrogenase (short-subunit alcohol dehydrogenase family)
MGAFTGKTAVVTGASSGIGRAVALRLGEAGAHVFAAGRRAEALAGTVQAVAGAEHLRDHRPARQAAGRPGAVGILGRLTKPFGKEFRT